MFSSFSAISRLTNEDDGLGAQGGLGRSWERDERGLRRRSRGRRAQVARYLERYRGAAPGGTSGGSDETQWWGGALRPEISGQALKFQAETGFGLPKEGAFRRDFRQVL